jgi:hypothetical protein
MLQLAKMQIEPQILVCSSTAGPDALAAARKPVGSVLEYGDGTTDDGGGEFDDGGRSFEVRLERSAAFTYDKVRTPYVARLACTNF